LLTEEFFRYMAIQASTSYIQHPLSPSVTQLDNLPALPLLLAIASLVDDAQDNNTMFLSSVGVTI